jgi:hypothetical protein
MSKQEIIAEATHLLDQLPADKAIEVLTLLAYAVQEAKSDIDLQAHYASLVHQKEEEDLRRDIMWAVEHGGAFDWLHDEPDIYTDEDLIEKYK